MNRSCAVTCPDAKYQRSRGHQEGRVDKRKRHHVRVQSPQPAFLGLGAAEGCTLGKPVNPKTARGVAGDLTRNPWSLQPAFLGLGAAEGCTLGKNPKP